MKPGFGALYRHGRAVAEHHNVGVATQLFRLATDYFSYGFSPNDFYLHQLYLPGRRRLRFREFAGLSHLFVVQSYLFWHCPDRPFLADKSLFAKRCGEVGLPTIPLLAEFVDGEMTGGKAADIPSADLFSKPSGRRRGYGANAWRCEGPDRYANAESGQVFDRDSLLDELCRQSKAGKGPIILQRKISNHSAIKPLTSGALSTTRLVSCRTPSGDIDFLPPTIRMPTGRSIVDNFWQGALAAPLELATGRICGPAVQRDEGLGLRTVHKHPDSGVELAGFQLPIWSEAVELARRAHSTFPSLPFVGWDIAILEDRPVVVEGNVLWGLDATLLPHGISLSDTQFIPYCNFHLDRRFAEFKD